MLAVSFCHLLESTGLFLDQEHISMNTAFENIQWIHQTQRLGSCVWVSFKLPRDVSCCYPEMFLELKVIVSLVVDLVVIKLCMYEDF